jgi:hypothetical protein
MTTLKQWETIQEDLVAALTKVAKKHNVTFERNGFRYGDNDCTFRVLATVNDASGAKRDLQREAYIAEAKNKWSDLESKWLDKSFTDRGRTYSIIGYAPSRKYSVVTRRDDGEPYFWTDSFIVQKMTGVKAAA